eukprot:SAG22_NODE_987_length_6142_cov_3.152242_7_plen_735_part_00
MARADAAAILHSLNAAFDAAEHDMARRLERADLETSATARYSSSRAAAAAEHRPLRPLPARSWSAPGGSRPPALSSASYAHNHGPLACQPALASDARRRPGSSWPQQHCPARSSSASVGRWPPPARPQHAYGQYHAPPQPPPPPPQPQPMMAELHRLRAEQVQLKQQVAAAVRLASKREQLLQQKLLLAQQTASMYSQELAQHSLHSPRGAASAAELQADEEGGAVVTIGGEGRLGLVFGPTDRETNVGASVEHIVSGSLAAAKSMAHCQPGSRALLRVGATLLAVDGVPTAQSSFPAVMELLGRIWRESERPAQGVHSVASHAISLRFGNETKSAKGKGGSKAPPPSPPPPSAAVSVDAGTAGNLSAITAGDHHLNKVGVKPPSDGLSNHDIMMMQLSSASSRDLLKSVEVKSTDGISEQDKLLMQLSGNQKEKLKKVEQVKASDGISDHDRMLMQISRGDKDLKPLQDAPAGMTKLEAVKWRRQQKVAAAEAEAEAAVAAAAATAQDVGAADAVRSAVDTATVSTASEDVAAEPAASELGASTQPSERSAAAEQTVTAAKIEATPALATESDSAVAAAAEAGPPAGMTKLQAIKWRKEQEKQLPLAATSVQELAPAAALPPNELVATSAPAAAGAPTASGEQPPAGMSKLEGEKTGSTPCSMLSLLFLVGLFLCDRSRMTDDFHDIACGTILHSHQVETWAGGQGQGVRSIAAAAAAAAAAAQFKRARGSNG